MSETVERTNETSAAPIHGAPPLSAQPVRASATDEARARLHRVAAEFVRTRNRKLLVEFLMLRRGVA